MIRFGTVFYVLGFVIFILGLLMSISLVPALYFGDGDALPIGLSSLLTMCVGGVTAFSLRKTERAVAKREGYLIVALGWVMIAVFSSLPYWLSHSIHSFTDMMFESISGLTTTGASILNDIEAMPRGILLWRSLTQWIGGMGIIVLTVAIFPLLGIGGVELFVAEAPGPTSEKIHPRIKETAKRLWFIYVGLTVVLAIILALSGMSIYDAVNHALTTLSTGGFSTKNSSAADFAPHIQYILILFMFMAGINFTVIYFFLTGNFKRAWKSDEFKGYLMFTLIYICIITFGLTTLRDVSVEQNFRDASFQIVSLVTTTGFVSADYTSWSPHCTMFFFLLLFSGGCAGSTSGGIKMIRSITLVKNSLLEFKRLIHPKAIIRTKVDGQLVTGRILTHILVFLVMYIILFIIGSLVMTIVLADFDQPFLTSIGSVATALGNVGPAIGDLGPVDNFAKVPVVGKWFLMFYMLLGRLELFTILVLFSPHFWKLN